MWAADFYPRIRREYRANTRAFPIPRYAYKYIYLLVHVGNTDNTLWAAEATPDPPVHVPHQVGPCPMHLRYEYEYLVLLCLQAWVEVVTRSRPR